jgi:hypothetical protein
LEGPEYRSSAAWCQLLGHCDAIVVVLYQAANRYLRRQLAIARALGKPVIRWWVGSDVLSALEDDVTRETARRLDRVVSRNVVVAPHLREELASIGLDAHFIPSLLEAESAPGVPDERLPTSLLVYLPSNRLEFYGLRSVRQIVQENPDVEFLIVADDTHCLAGYRNVRSLGWVDDMNAVWATTGGLLRLTRHDGMPRMVLEALRRGKDVIYSWPFPGCRLARDLEETRGAVAEFKATRAVNRIGVQAVKDLLDPDPVVQFAQAIESALASSTFRSRLSGLCFAIGDTFTLKLRPADRRDSVEPF